MIALLRDRGENWRHIITTPNDVAKKRGALLPLTKGPLHNYFLPNYLLPIALYEYPGLWLWGVVWTCSGPLYGLLTYCGSWLVFSSLICWLVIFYWDYPLLYLSSKAIIIKRLRLWLPIALLLAAILATIY